MGNGKLSEKQSKFVLEYLKDFNGTQAAIRAGYAKGSASVQASRLLVNDNVIEYLAAQREKTRTRVQITQEEVLESLKEIRDRGLQKTRTVDIIDRVGGKNEGTEKRTMHQLQAAAKATELMGKHLGMFKEHEGQSQGPVTIVLQLPEGIRRGEGNKAEAQGAGREAVPAEPKPEDPA